MLLLLWPLLLGDSLWEEASPPGTPGPGALDSVSPRAQVATSLPRELLPTVGGRTACLCSQGFGSEGTGPLTSYSAFPLGLKTAWSLGPQAEVRWRVE